MHQNSVWPRVIDHTAIWACAKSCQPWTGAYVCYRQPRFPINGFKVWHIDSI